MRVALAFMLLAGCLGESSPPPTPAPPAPKLYKAPLPSIEIEAPMIPVAEDLSFAAGLEVRPAVHDGRLSLVPILATDPPADAPVFLTLAAGMASGQVVATDTGDIWRVVISNRSQRPLAILGGELLVQGKQDRLLARNIVIAPGRTQVVSAVCAEPGRMEGGAAFQHGHAIAEPMLRHLARADQQLEVWQRIRAINGASEIWTSSYRVAAKAQTKGANGARHEQLLAALDTIERREERGKLVGVAVAIDHRIVAIERFESPQLFRDLRGMLIASYLPGTGGTARPSERGVTAADVRKFAAGSGQPLIRNPAAARSAGSPARP
jgi:hypothetical protein